MSEILVVLGHPNPKSFCGGLADRYQAAIEGAGVSTARLNITELNFDPILHNGYSEIQPLEPDLIRAQQLIEEARHITWFFPMWWVGLPAQMKGFVDRTFLPGWAFRYKDGGFPEKLLNGRSARVVSTMDSPGWWYRLGYRRSLSTSFGTGTLKFSGISPVSQSPIYGVHEMNDAARERALDKMLVHAKKDLRALHKRTQSLPSWSRSTTSQ